MFCHRCGAQVGEGAQFCPSCGESVGAANPLAVSATTAWIPPTGVQSQSGRWLSAGWQLVKNDLGNYLLVSLVFTLLNGVPFIQGALIAGFHIYTAKKLVGRQPEF